MIDADLIRAAIERIDAASTRDPAGRAVAYAQRMTCWLGRLCDEPSPALAIAVRAQHLRRWEIPRGSYPKGRSGYLRWRRACARHHAEEASRILTDLGCPEALIARVQALIRKEGLGRDWQTQILEDAACLSFLQAELADFAQGREVAELKRVLSRTWGKMSPRAHALALILELPTPLREMIDAVNAGAAQ